MLYLCLGLCRASIPEEEGGEEPKFSRILRENPGFIQHLFTSTSVQEKRVGKIERAGALDDSKYKRVQRSGAVDDDNHKRVLRAANEEDRLYKRVQKDVNYGR